ncbi:MAG TPA: nitrilase-related carbon-nitrogen hydrolase [Acidobacteriota bacterium]|nr:nitrilase-related carbon-nitrogen hydrolase [Acidobacteriota bacterium]
MFKKSPGNLELIKADGKLSLSINYLCLMPCMNSQLKYYAAAIQTNMPNPVNRAEMKKNTARICHLIDQAIVGYSPFLPVRLLVFPEFAHAAPVYKTLRELREKLGIEIPNEHTEALCEKAREYGVYIQTGTMLEIDRKYPNALFNTTCLIGPEGILYRYRKVYPWIPWEVSTSPHDIAGYEEELFPVADTPIGRLGAAICYDWLFPETLRQLTANGAEVLLRVSAYMDPFGATAPTDWWTVVNRCRALENVCYVVAANQAASLEKYPPFSWPGGSMIVDYDGRIVSQASPGEGERIVVGPVSVDMLRTERATRLAHQMLAHLRTEAHPVYRCPGYPGGDFGARPDFTYEDNRERIEAAKERRGYRPVGSSGEEPARGSSAGPGKVASSSDERG